MTLFSSSRKPQGSNQNLGFITLWYIIHSWMSSLFMGARVRTSLKLINSFTIILISYTSKIWHTSGLLTRENSCWFPRQLIPWFLMNLSSLFLEAIILTDSFLTICRSFKSIRKKSFNLVKIWPINSSKIINKIKKKKQWFNQII